MFTCTICLIEYIDNLAGIYGCISGHINNEGYWDTFCDTLICVHCEFDVNLPQIEINWKNLNFDWLCSYKCLLEYMTFRKKYNLTDLSVASIPYIHNKHAEKEIKNEHRCIILIKDLLYPNDLAKLIIEFLL